MASYDAATQIIIGLAKRAAVARNSNSIGVDDIAMGLYLAGSNAAVAQALAAANNQAKASVVWPAQLQALGPKVTATADPGRPLTVEPELREALHRAATESASMPPVVLARHLLRCKTALIAELVSANAGQSVKPEPATSGAVAHFEQLYETSEVLRRKLADAVVGQDAAVEMLAQAYFRSQAGRAAAGPRGILTFLGPPGVGKTMLAEAFGKAVAELQGAAPAFKRFDMGNYSAHQQHEGLFGFESAFSGSQPGALTGFVKDNPSCVLLFDEIEKAHENTLLALLAVFDKGEATDKKLAVTVSFKDTWIVVTTNLGREFFGNANDSGILHSGNVPAAVVFDVLATARRRQDMGQDGAPPALPPELVSRLAKGNAVIFGRLAVSHLVQLVGRAAEERLGEASADRPVPAIQIAADARLAFLLSLLPNLDARQVVARSGAWAVDLLQDSIAHLRKVPQARTAASFAIAVRAGPDLAKFVATKLGEAPLRLLVIDDDAHLPALLARYNAHQPLEIKHISLDADPGDAVRRFRPEAVLLDLSIAEDAWSPRVVTAVRLLQAVREAQPDLPCLLFSDNPENRESFDDVVQRVVRSGGARAFLPCRRKSEDALEMEDFAARLHAQLAEIRSESLVRAAQRERRTLRWQVQFRWEHPGTAVAELVAPQEVVVVSAADQAGAIAFSGIPSDTFDDVIGLDRAKQRLRQVVAWLRDDNALRAFGVHPPSGFLLAGPPGTGKTLLARALAGEAKLPFLALSAGELQSKWVGESEERVRELFDKARRYAPAIVFIDEIDAVARRRSEEGSGAAAMANTLNQLLASMDGVAGRGRRVFVLAATNHPESLDPAIRRPGRFDETIPIDLPNSADRRKFFEFKLKHVPGARGLDLSQLVAGTTDCSPAELDRIVREAIYLAAAEGRAALQGPDLEAARRLVRFGADKHGIRARPEDLACTAWHEAGHAVVQLALLPHMRIDHVSVVANERGALGYMAPVRDESITEWTAADVRARIAVALAGREAELLRPGHHGHLGAGAASDLEAATRQALAAVTRWGMDGEFGSLVVEALPEALQQAVATKAQERVQDWLSAGRRKARQILENNRDHLTSLAQLLLVRERLGGEDLAVLAALLRDASTD